MVDPTSSNLAANIKRLREAQNLTQQELADASGVPRPTIANLESGTANPTLSVLLKVAAALSASIEELVSGSGPSITLHRGKTLPERRRAGAALRRLIPDGARSLAFERLEIAPGGRLGVRAEGLGTREYLACEIGEIELALADAVVNLGAGDVAALVADQPRDYANRGRRAAVAYRLVVTTAAAQP
jgi:transcriptional regulator with XRE-family HTH domain